VEEGDLEIAPVCFGFVCRGKLSEFIKIRDLIRENLKEPSRLICGTAATHRLILEKTGIRESEVKENE
jgi:hypothetical protein